MNKPGFAPHPVFKGKFVKLPPVGKLNWLGGNMAIDSPIMETVMDCDGNVSNLSLYEVLNRIDQFVGYREDMPIKTNLILNAFSAYEYGLMVEHERVCFEEYVRKNISQLSQFEAAKKLMS